MRPKGNEFAQSAGGAEAPSRILLAVGTEMGYPRLGQPLLSNRELHVLKEVAEGLSNKQIARQLGISEKTVRNHLSRVFHKLEASNRTQAVMRAIRLGL
jgi:DNA-binding NarL/FixJ family response regulator